MEGISDHQHIGTRKPENGLVTYLDIEILVDLKNLPKDVDILHEIGKLPAVPQALQQTWLFGLLLGCILDFGVGTLSRYHGGGSKASGAAAQGWFPQLFFSRDMVGFQQRV